MPAVHAKSQVVPDSEDEEELSIDIPIHKRINDMSSIQTPTTSMDRPGAHITQISSFSDGQPQLSMPQIAVLPDSSASRAPDLTPAIPMTRSGIPLALLVEPIIASTSAPSKPRPRPRPRPRTSASITIGEGAAAAPLNLVPPPARPSPPPEPAPIADVVSSSIPGLNFGKEPHKALDEHPPPFPGVEPASFGGGVAERAKLHSRKAKARPSAAQDIINLLTDSEDELLLLPPTKSKSKAKAKARESAKAAPKEKTRKKSPKKVNTILGSPKVDPPSLTPTSLPMATSQPDISFGDGLDLPPSDFPPSTSTTDRRLDSKRASERESDRSSSPSRKRKRSPARNHEDDAGQMLPPPPPPFFAGSSSSLPEEVPPPVSPPPLPPAILPPVETIPDSPPVVPPSKTKTKTSRKRKVVDSDESDWADAPEPQPAPKPRARKRKAIGDDDDEDGDWDGDISKSAKAKGKRKAPAKTYGRGKKEDVVPVEAAEEVQEVPKKATKRGRKAQKVVVEVDLPPRSRTSASRSPIKGAGTIDEEVDSGVGSSEKRANVNEVEEPPAAPVPAPESEPPQPKSSGAAAKSRKKKRSGTTTTITDNEDARAPSPQASDTGAASKEAAPPVPDDADEPPDDSGQADEVEPVSNVTSKKPSKSTPSIVATPQSKHAPSSSALHASTSTTDRVYRIPRRDHSSMDELIRRANALPGSPFPAARPTYSPLVRMSRNSFRHVVPLHPNRKTPPPPPPRPPPPKKTKKMLELEEKWEMELQDTVEGWYCLSEEERAQLRRAKRDKEFGFDD